ncbi:hypothetical protein PHMEG_0009524 [Phytophthora megakarya]|uniref:DDE Tnp4 domain-containing protein n=1 Tax=Phytophthora megakarya TaxID=4795 RepID=A0A225WGL2_9STRA|nr:hypothetical protein PHMEG_0009524 [Phytophthora megakarya]
MPRTSERQRLLGEIIDVLAVAILEEETDDDLLELYGYGVLQRVLSSDDISSPVEDLMDLLAFVEARRYLEDHDRLPKCVEFRENGIQAVAAKDFRQTTRVSHVSFSRILSEIENHGVFQNYSDCGQAPVWLQLAVVLDRLENYGNRASLGRTQKLWGIGHGTCALYTTRVLLALKDLASSYVVWPSPEERRSMSRRMGLKGFRGCVGFIDGTTIPLSQKPAVDGACFFDRKHRYSVNAQVVCDDRSSTVECGLMLERSSITTLIR